MASSPSVLAQTWPLVGRDAQLAQISQARLDPECPGVVISAAAGVGRSRLAREACAAAEAAGDLVYWARATESSAAIPLGAFAALIPDDVRSDEPLELIRRSTERVRDRAAGRRVCLGVDDADLLDPASAALVLHLATAAEVFVVATVRTGATAPDAIDALWKDAGALRIQLAPLDGMAIEELVQRVLGGPAEQAVLRRAADSSAGNPLFARELVLGAIDEGRLRFDQGMWRLSQRAVSPSLTGIVERRMGTLTEAERDAAQLLALGEPLRLSELDVLAEPQTLETLEARELITIDPGRPEPVARLAQPLYGEVLRAQLPVLRGRALRLRLAELVGRRDPLTPDDALRVARWHRDCGTAVPAALRLDAAGAAVNAGDLELAVELASAALQDGGGLAAALVLGRAHASAGRLAEAETVLAGVESEAASAPDALAYLAQRIQVLVWGLGELARARALLARAEEWSSDPAWRQALDPWRLVASGFVAGAGAPAPDAGEAPASERGRRERELAEIFRAMAAGEVVAAEDRVRRIRPRAPLGDDLDGYALGLVLIVGLESGRDWADLRTFLEQVLRDGVRGGDHQSAGLAAFGLCALDMCAGRYRDAASWVAEADAHFAVQDAFGTLFSLRALEVGIATLTGDPARAREGLATLRAMLRGAAPLPTQVGYLVRAEGWAARALSPRAGAEAFLAAAADTEQPLLAARLLHEALRCGASPVTIAQELARPDRACDARLVAAYRAHAGALAARDAAALIEVAGQFRAIGADAFGLEAAVAAAERYVTDGRVDSARRAATLAAELHPDGQGTDPPAIDGLDGVAIELTPREAQIAALAAHGLTNQDIAAELVISVRTVETYVYRAMQKRGVSSRREL